MKTFSTRRCNHLFMSQCNIESAKNKLSQLLTHRTEKGKDWNIGEKADHIHMSEAPEHPAFTMVLVYFGLIEAFSCLQLTQKQKPFIYGRLRSGVLSEGGTLWIPALLILISHCVQVFCFTCLIYWEIGGRGEN